MTASFDPRLDLSLAEFMALPREARPRAATPTPAALSKAERLTAARIARQKARKVARIARKKAKAYRLVEGVEILRLDPCSYCDDAHPTTHDHVEPVSKGGAHDLSNLTRSCWRCNREKATYSLVVFLARRAFRTAA